MECNYPVKSGSKKLCRLALAGLDLNGENLPEGSTEVALKGIQCPNNTQFALRNLCAQLFSGATMNRPPNSRGYGAADYRGGISSEEADVGSPTS